MKLRIWNKTLHIDDDLVAEYQKTSYCVAKSVSAIPDYEYMHLAETSGANESSSGRELKKAIEDGMREIIEVDKMFSSPEFLQRLSDFFANRATRTPTNTRKTCGNI